MDREFTQEHIMKLCLPPELYLAVTKFRLQASNYLRLRFRLESVVPDSSVLSEDETVSFQ